MTASDQELMVITERVRHVDNRLGGSTAVGDWSEDGCILVTVSRRISSAVEEQQ